MRALVIGGSGSIGSAIVDRLLEEDYEVIIHYNRSDITMLKQKYAHQKVSFVQCDLAQNTSDIMQHFEFVQNLDCLIYAAGQSLYGMVQDMDDTLVDYCYRINVKSLIQLTRGFINQLRRSSNGRIIVISSIWGETGASMEVVYSTMKAAQIGFVKALSQELSLTNITVNAVAPGFVSGNMADEWSESERAEIINDLPQQRMVAPEEVAYTCAYLYHPMAQSVTGTVQKVNGGWYI